MKTKITIISLLAIALLSFNLVTKNASHSKNNKHSSETRVNKGLAMEDKNQFN